MKRNGLWAWVSLKIVLVVAVIEALLVLFESINYINCHFSGTTECWPFFFAMATNLPVSIGIMQFNSAVSNTFQIDSIWFQLILESLSFFVVGTLWWSSLLHIPVLIAKLVNKWRARAEN
jgi:hypothetical protein